MTDEELVARYKSGEKLREIADAAGCCLQTVANRVRRLRGVLPYRIKPMPKSHPRRRLAAARKELAIKLHNAGLSKDQIATRLGIVPEYAYQLVSRELPKCYDSEISRVETLLAEVS